jgi:Ribbon-helix-helix protein, copG family
MRTTLTLDDDVAAVIERLRRDRDANLKDIVNEALREGLKHMTAPRQKPVRFRTETADLGRCLLANVDNVAETLAVAEGDAFR